MNGLDRQLARYVRKRKGIFVEAGANDGVRQSNTLYFEKYKGWTGLLIEAMPELAERCRINRPKCLVENAALVAGDYRHTHIDLHYRDLMSVVKGAIADADREKQHLVAGEAFMKQGDEPRTISVRACTLSSILEKHHMTRVDLLSLDVEGYETEVLRGLDFERHQPRFMLLEVRERDPIESLISPWYQPRAILHENKDYADILYVRKRDGDGV